MAITTKTQAANMALNHVGEPPLADYATDTGTTADSVRLHFEHVLGVILEEYNWNFAKVSSQPTAADSYVTADLTIEPAGADNTMVFTAKATGAAGNNISIAIATPGAALAVTVSDYAITITPKASPASTAQEVIDAVNASTAASALVTASASGPVTGTVEAAIAAAFLTGGKMWRSAFQLPSDCVKLRTINDSDIDAPRTRFDIEGRYLLFLEADAEAPIIEYTSSSIIDSINTWPSTFTDAYVLLLASRLAKSIQQNDTRSNALLNDYRNALGKARSKDARESMSGENFGPRQLAARSGLVRSRYGSTPPPY